MRPELNTCLEALMQGRCRLKAHDEAARSLPLLFLCRLCSWSRGGLQGVKELASCDSDSRLQLQP